MQVNESIFRDYDIRGLVDRDIDDNFARVFGRAFGTYLARRGTGEVLVGYDARHTSPKYYEACQEGLRSAGTNVIRIGLATSPMMYWARKYYKVDGGLLITASHNPPEFNGFKPASGHGALFGEEIQKIKRLMISEDFASGQGAVSDQEIFGQYVKDIKSKVKITRRLSVIVDCGNSTAGPYAPAVLEALGIGVERLFCDIDPEFPNHPPDPENPAAYPKIQELIKSGRHDMGLIFDGDADRLGAVDAQGNVVRGDQITALAARRVLEDKPGGKILFEVQCSKSAMDDVEAHGGRAILVRVGHSYIEQALLKQKAQLAGETSGHVFFVDRWYGFDDAIYAAARLVEYVAESGKSLKELVQSLPKYISVPKTRITAPEERKFAMVGELKDFFTKKGYKINDTDGVRLEWDDGWAVVRASNTQPALTLRAEAKTKSRLAEIKKIMEDALAKYKAEGVNLEWGRTD